MAKSALTSLEDQLDLYLVKKAPFQIPVQAKEWIVKYSPWITLVILILSAPAVLALLGLSAVVGAFATAVGVQTGIFYWSAMIFLILQLVLMAVAIPGLMKRKKSAWNLVFYSSLVALVYSILHWISDPIFATSIIGTVVGAIIGWYVIFQVRSYYN